MKRLSVKTIIFFAFVFFAGSLIFPPYAKAYLDPGSGSYLFQILIAAFFGLTFTIKVYWHKIVDFAKTYYKSLRKRLQQQSRE